MLNYKSHHQSKHKMNVAKNFIHRVWYLTRNKSKDEIVAIIHRHLQLNDYPRQLINRLINLYENKKQLSTQRATTTVIEITENTQSRPSRQPPTPPAILPAVPSPSTLIEINEDTQNRSSRQPPTPPAILPAVPTPPTLNVITEDTHSRPYRQPPTPPAILPAVPTSTPPARTETVENTDQSRSTHKSSTSPATESTQLEPLRPPMTPSQMQQQHEPLSHHRSASSGDNHDHPTSPPQNTISNQPNTTNPAAEQPETTNNVKTYRAIPYIPALSQKIINILAKDYPNLTITTKQNRVIKSLHTQVKQPIIRDDVSNTIYKIPCSNCECCYIGMTTNTLRKRLAGHRSNVNRLDKLINDNNTNTEIAKTSLIETTTALIQHCVEQNHRFDLERTQIIDHSYKQSTLPFLEMCHITNTDHTVNKRTDIDRLSTTYAAVLHDIKSRREQNAPKRNVSDERDSIVPIGHANQSER
ncbi:uncharacterized protein LOC134285069 [Aedes albopictus]|uniref:Helix-turn-helix domain-containing protein n=1 Tax=Aedes albopictus TaxID=7160 RepID=A0ABM1Y6C3_AEDAL